MGTDREGRKREMGDIQRERERGREWGDGKRERERER